MAAAENGVSDKAKQATRVGSETETIKTERTDSPEYTPTDPLPSPISPRQTSFRSSSTETVVVVLSPVFASTAPVEAENPPPALASVNAVACVSATKVLASVTAMKRVTNVAKQKKKARAGTYGYTKRKRVKRSAAVAPLSPS